MVLVAGWCVLVGLASCCMYCMVLVAGWWVLVGLARLIAAACTAMVLVAGWCVLLSQGCTCTHMFCVLSLNGNMS